MSELKPRQIPKNSLRNHPHWKRLIVVTVTYMRLRTGQTPLTAEIPRNGWSAVKVKGKRIRGLCSAGFTTGVARFGGKRLKGTPAFAGRKTYNNAVTRGTRLTGAKREDRKINLDSETTTTAAQSHPLRTRHSVPASSGSVSSRTNHIDPCTILTTTIITLVCDGCHPYPHQSHCPRPLRPQAFPVHPRADMPPTAR